MSVVVCAFLLSSCGQEVADIPEAPLLSAAEALTELATIEKAIVKKPTDPAKLFEWQNAHLYLRKARYMLNLYELSDGVLEYISEELTKAKQSEQFVSADGRTPLILGEREEAYYSDNDDSFQPFLRYVPRAVRRSNKLPLIVFLHGYSPGLNIINWSHLPKLLKEFAERRGFLLAAPFGRSNTDFQGIGEQDVLNVINEMKKRYRVDDDRIILVGYSMGGMGAWTIGAHYSDLFAGLVIMSGRGDYYFWQDISRDDLPVYKQELIDADFGYSLLTYLKDIPIFSVHGVQDNIISIEEARHMIKAVKRVNPDVEYIELEAGHFIYEDVFGRNDFELWMLERKRVKGSGRAKRPKPFSKMRGPVKKAFLSPFIFVAAGRKADQAKIRRFQAAAVRWYRFAKSPPRMIHESKITEEQLAKQNVFLFGEPEDSDLIRAALAGSVVEVTNDSFVVAGRSFPREGNGMYVVCRSPWNEDKLAVVQCGLPWGRGLPENHTYDFLPDYIIYSSERDDDGSNSALCAGFFDEKWKVAVDRMHMSETTMVGVE